MASSKESDSKKTMDVSKPGKTAPDTSSRPVIVTHKPTVQDPMVKTDTPVVDETKKEVTKPAGTTQVHSKVIQPLSNSSDVKPEEPEASESKAEESNNDAAVVDAVAEQADLGPKNKNTGLSEAEKKKREVLAKLIEEKKYFVPVGQVAHRRNRRAFIIILVLLIALAGIYGAADAELIDINVDLPFDLIKT